MRAGKRKRRVRERNRFEQLEYEKDKWEERKDGVVRKKSRESSTTREEDTIEIARD